MNGGAAYFRISNNGKLVIDNSSELHQCIAQNGGAMFIDMIFANQTKVEIKDALIKDCEA
jgi:hypothetical protein